MLGRPNEQVKLGIEHIGLEMSAKDIILELLEYRW
jgi:hypothetical protein